MALKLPIFVTSKKDLLRLRREAEKMASSLLQQRIAKEKSNVSRKVYQPSEDLKQFLAFNKISVNEESINKLDNELKEIYEKAPQIRVSFANEPDQGSLEKIAHWFRSHTNPMMFIQVGIQPTIAGGCVLRTPHKRFDFSLRSALLKSSPKLMEAIANVGR